MKSRMIGLLVFLLGTIGLYAQEKKPLPKVVLVGDSIRLGYAPLVAKKLEGKAIVVSFKENGADSKNVLKNLEKWVISQKPDLVHLNCGLHDIKFDKKTKTHQVPLDEYEKNLRAIHEQISKNTKAIFIFALTTPIHDDRHAMRNASFDRFEKDVVLFNTKAGSLMTSLKVPLNDLHEVVMKKGMDKMLGKDGTHYTPEGNAELADAVAQVILKQIESGNSSR